MENYLQGWRKYADFSGRATRPEFWTFILVNNVLFPQIAMFSPYLFKVLFFFPAIFSFIVLVPTLAIVVRRLHDTGNSGWFFFLPIYNLILLFTEGDSGPNKYGPDPYGDPEEPNIEDHFVA